MTDAFTPPTQRNAGGPPTLPELGRRLRRQWALMLGIVVFVVGGVAIWTFTTRPLYRSTARVQVVSDDSGLPGLDDISSLPGLDLAGFDEGELETEMGILRSRRIQAPVVDSLGLQVRLDKPRRRRDEVVRVLGVDAPDVDATLELEPSAEGRWRVEVDVARDAPPVGPVPEEVGVGEPFDIGGVRLALAPELLRDSPGRIEIELVPTYEVFEDLEDDLEIRRQEGGSRLIEVRYTSPDRVLAAAVVNAMVAEYVAYRRTTEIEEIVEPASRLRREVADHADSLALAEERLRAYQEAERVVEPEEQAVQQLERLGELQVRLDALDVERQALRELLALIEERSEGGDPAVYRQLATFPTFISNGAIQNILEVLVEVESERTALLARRTPDNDDVRQLGQRITELEEQLHRLASQYLESLDGQYAAAARSRDEIAAELEALPERGMQYARLLRDQTVLGEIWLLLQEQLKQAEIREVLYTDEIRVVDTGEVPHPDDPVFPKPLVNLLLATVLGLSAALAVALSRDMWDGRIRGEQDALDAAPGVPLVGVIPSSRGRRLKRGGSDGRLPVAASPTRVDPWSEMAEAYRSVASRIARTNGQRRSGLVLLVTSGEEREGKSSVAANLAVALAQQGRSTLLVDGDLRTGTLHALFDVPADPGLRQLLEGAVSLGECVSPIDLPEGGGHLSVLPRGTSEDGTARPLGLAGGETVDRVFREMRAAAECVVIDAPTLRHASEAELLAARADGLLVVARAGVTDRDALRRTVERLGRVAGRVEGIVLAEG